MISSYCKKYREDNNLTLSETIKLSGVDCKVGTLSAFEMGRSTNIEHLTIYIKVSKCLNNTFEFMNNLTVEVLKNGE